MNEIGVAVFVERQHKQVGDFASAMQSSFICSLLAACAGKPSRSSLGGWETCD
jgi:hypothetical protein